MEENARRKALEVFALSPASPNDPSSPSSSSSASASAPFDLVIGCDTVVVCDNRILEKPRDHAHAFDMLRSLSGRAHYVLSGVALVFRAVSPGQCQVVQYYYCIGTRCKF